MKSVLKFIVNHPIFSFGVTLGVIVASGAWILAKATFSSGLLVGIVVSIGVTMAMALVNKVGRFGDD